MVARLSKGNEMSDNSNSSSGGIGICGLLFVLFVGLKLTDNIDWSWWYVSAPLWAPVTVFLLGGLIVLCIMVAYSCLKPFFK